MKLDEGRSATLNLVRSYDAAGVVVGTARLPLPVLLTPSGTEPGFASPSLAALRGEDLQLVLDRAPEVVLAGSAGGLRMAPSSLRRTLEERRIALECMDLGAACRTFNVLAQEDRQVLALLFP